MVSRMSLHRRNKIVDKNSLALRVMTMDAELEFTVAKTATGKDVFELICRAIGLRETWYFGLQYQDIKGFVSWLKTSKLLLKQNLPVDGFMTLTLLARFYPEDVSEELVQEITQHLFFLQVRQSILHNQVFCPPEEAILLASYDAQVKLGDVDDISFQPGAFPLEEFLPLDLIQQFPNMSREAWESRIRPWHAQHRGVSRNEAEMEYLKVAQNLEMFGNKKESELNLGVTAFGLNVYEKPERRKPKINFPWSEIKNVSYEDTKFIIRPVDKKVQNFSFYSSDLKINKIILDLCMGNHDLFLRRRKPDSIEVQQMKLQAKEEKARRHIERQRFLKERHMREQLQREKQELQGQILHMQEEIRMANDEMRRCQETASLLAEKAQISAEESILLNQKAMDAEAEMQQLKLTVLRSEEEKVSMEQKVRDAQMIAARMVDEAERRALESERLKEEMLKARMLEKMARDRLMEISRPSNYRLPPTSQDVRDYAYDGEFTNGNGRCAQNMSPGNVDMLSVEIEREKMEYLEKSKHLQEQLSDLRSELETIKTDDGLNGNGFALVDVNGMRKDKFATLQKASSGSTKMRITHFEGL